MDILIDNKNLKTYFGIDCLDYSGALSFPAPRENERVWYDKSGVENNLVNRKIEAKEFLLSCYCKASTEGAAYNLINTLLDYIQSVGCFVLSLRDTTRSIRECYLCERSGAIVGEVYVRQQNGLYVFKLGLKDVNPNALKFKTTIASLSASINYTKGITSTIYWGDGTIGQVSNSGTYSKTYAANGLVDIIVDVDKDSPTITPLVAGFTADVVSGIKPLTVQFTDTSTGIVDIYSWNFGDGNTSSESDPQHIYTQAGTYTVTLQIFNSVKGYDIEEKVGYITVRDAWLLINGADRFLVGASSTDLLLEN